MTTQNSGTEVECEHMLILGETKHYCNRENEHYGRHHCHCGFEWSES